MLETEKSILEYDSETIEKALVETALAYHYRGAYVQYDLRTSVTAQGQKGGVINTMEVPPEWCGADRSYYSVCRGIVSDIYYEALGMTIHGNRYGVHPSLVEEDIKRSVVVCFGDPDNFPETTYTDKDAFLKEYRKVIRPGDYVMADKRTSHLMMYLGDCFGTGEEFMLHCWPVRGGNWDPETGINKYEPHGAGHIQPMEELNFTVENAPKWDLTLEEMKRIWLFRPSRTEAFKKLTMPLHTLSRIKYSGLSLNKYASKTVFDSVLPGEILTITEEISNYGRAPYEGLQITEPVPTGTKIIPTSVLVEGAGRGTKVQTTADKITLSLNLPSYEKATLSFRVKVTGKPGELVQVKAGMADQIPTRAFDIHIGKSKFNLQQMENIYLYGNSNTRFRKFFEKASPDLESVNEFYKLATGKELRLPKTTQELLDIYFDRMPLPAYGKNEAGEKIDTEVMMLKLKENLPAEYEAMRIPRSTGGKYVALSDDLRNTERSFDWLDKYYSTGDLFIMLRGENQTTVTNLDEVWFAFYIRTDLLYIWNGKEWHKHYWNDCMQDALINNVILGLRPNNAI